MLKSELRKIYLAKQKSLSNVEREAKSMQITELFFELFDLKEIKYLHCFLPIEKFREVNTKLIFETIWKNFPHIITVVPRVDFQTNEIENLTFARETNLVRNVWQIHEPNHHEFIETEKIDLVIVPLVCFDERGFRVGYGKGFYDKFLKKCRHDCLKIGVSLFAPTAELSDAEAHDVRLDYCLTPEKLWNFKGGESLNFVVRP